MRTLGSPLTTSVNATTRIPAISATVEDHVRHFTSYQTPSDTDGEHNACTADDGSIIRVRVSRASGGALTRNFQWQRVTTPGTAGQWTTWTSFTGGAGNIYEQGGCCVSNNGGTLRAFAQRGTGGNNIWTWSSTDNGATWSGAATSVLSPPGGALTSGIASAGNNDVFFLYDVVGGVKVGYSFFSAGSWSAIATWSLSALTAGSGLAAYYDGSKYWIIYSDGYSLGEATYTVSGATWAQLLDIAPSTSTALGRLSPRILYDSSTSTYHLTAIDIDSGSMTGSIYNYPRVRQSKDLTHWSQGFILHQMSTSYSASLISSGGYLYAVTMARIYRAADYNAATASQKLTISNTILSYKRVELVGQPAHLEIILDNNASALTSYISASNAYEPIGPNCSVILNEGYKTGSPLSTPTTIQTGTYRINQIIVRRSPDESQIKLICKDLSRRLDLINRYQQTYTSQTISYLVKEICARAGLLSISVPATTQMSYSVSIFILQAGRSYRNALDELCSIYALEYFLDQDETMQVKEINSADASGWTYKPEIESLTIASDDDRANHTIVTGKPPASFTLVGSITTGEAHDDSNAAWVGEERITHHVDQRLAAAADCATKATFLLSQEGRSESAHSITVPLNPALQLLDVITIQDQTSPTGTSISKDARIIRSEATYNAQIAEYSITLDMEAP